jgi:hypothetical protein
MEFGDAVRDTRGNFGVDMKFLTEDPPGLEVLGDALGGRL